MNSARLVETAVKLIAIPSPTGAAGEVAACLAGLLAQEGFDVERPVAGHPAAPAVVTRLDSGKPGRTLILNGHLDTVHLPFVPPAVEAGRITGSGSADMKGGVAAAVEALRMIREQNGPRTGCVLFVAHDLHEAPWGLGEQLDRLIQEGLTGDAVLIPESLSGHLPVRGRGCATWRITLSREGGPVHEVMRPSDEPDVVRAGAEMIRRLHELNERVRVRADPVAGAESVFVGQVHGGEMYNQYAKECWLEGTRRWLPESDAEAVEPEFRGVVEEVARSLNVGASVDYKFIRGAFQLDLSHPIVEAFQRSYRATTGQALPEGPKAFVDDGNSFWSLAGIPAITHGAEAAGQHTIHEWISIEDLMRVARVYVGTAAGFCGAFE